MSSLPNMTSVFYYEHRDKKTKNFDFFLITNVYNLAKEKIPYDEEIYVSEEFCRYGDAI